MKRFAWSVLTVAALGLSFPASAQFTHGQRAPWSSATGYESKGQCQSVMQQHRNRLRDNAALRDPQNRALSAADWNHLFDTQWECSRNDDNYRWYITWELR